MKKKRRCYEKVDAVAAPPPRRHGKIRARLIFKGHSKPVLRHLEADELT